MYAYLKGILVDHIPGQVVVENQGIGYLIYTPGRDFPPIGEPVTVYTYLHVKEDRLELYGFSNENQQQLFTQLISVSGVGTKTAIQVLADLSPSVLVTAILQEDLNTLTRVKGLGAKTAKRLVLELKDKLKGMQRAELTPSLTNNEAADPVEEITQQGHDVLEALLMLGWPMDVAREVVAAHTDPSAELETNIRRCLQALDRRG